MTDEMETTDGWNDEISDTPEDRTDIATPTDTPADEEFPIIKNAELPRRLSPHARSKYPFEELVDVNDAFVVKTDKPKYTRSSIYAARGRVAPDMKVTVRTVEGGLHVQRIA